MAARIAPEHRKYPRLQSSLHLNLGHRAERFKTWTKNISACGLLCQIDKWLPLMTKLRISIFLPFRKIICTGVIVRIERRDERYNIAVFFSDISQQDRTALVHYVRSRVTKQASPAYSGN